MNTNDKILKLIDDVEYKHKGIKENYVEGWSACSCCHGTEFNANFLAMLDDIRELLGAERRNDEEEKMKELSNEEVDRALQNIKKVTI